MSWVERLRVGKYTSPSGIEFEIEFFELSRESAKKAPTQSLFGTDDNDTQDLGNSITELPMSIFFSGDDYDLISDRFWDALSEKGTANFAHPRWGNLTVLPVSRIQREDPVNEARRAEFNVRFKIINQKSFPVIGAQTESEIVAVLDEVQESESETFSEALKSDLLNEKNEIESYFQGINTLIDENITPLVESSEAILEQYNLVFNNLINNVDELIEDPIALGQNYIRLLRLPARAAASVEAKLLGYTTVITELFSTLSSLNNQTVSLVSAINRNRAIQQELIAFGALAAITESLLVTEYSTDLLTAFPEITNTDQLSVTEKVVVTKSQVFELIDSLLTTFDLVVDALDQNQVQFEDQVFTQEYQYSAEGFEHLSDSVSKTVGLLIEKSFSLRIENRIINPSDQTPINLTAQFYGQLNLLDFFITSNNLGSEELFLVPAGRELLIYA